VSDHRPNSNDRKSSSPYFVGSLRLRARTLVSDGARSFAAQQELELVEPAGLISPASKDEWQKWRTRLDTLSSNAVASIGEGPVGLRNRQDTVGAVALDGAGDLASGVSRYPCPLESKMAPHVLAR
jgi:hypothetical protein